jgi:antitoxin HigA-1
MLAEEFMRPPTPQLWLNLQSDYDLRRARAGDWPKIEWRVWVLAAE